MSNSNQQLFLHRAPLVVPVTSPVLENGAVLVENNKIIQVDRFESINCSDAVIIDHDDSVLVPGLINCHAHLELSNLYELGVVNNYFEAGDVTSWIYELIRKRIALFGGADSPLVYAQKALAEMHRTGVVAVADIGNGGENQEIGTDSPVYVKFFLEAFGLSKQEVPDVHSRLLEHENLSWTAHAPYSTSPELITSLKKRAISRGELFPIHIAESADEIEFLKDGSGRFLDFLNKRLQESSGPKAPAISDIFTPPGCGAVSYLAKLGVLDKETLCVHAVHVDSQEIDLLSKQSASVCLCPASNKFLGVGRAPVDKFIKAGVRTCLGTDSLASNSVLSIWHEMQILAEDHPTIDPKIIFEMATINGAEVLGIHNLYGSLAPGQKAAMLSVKGVDLVKNHIFENLVHAGLNLTVNLL